MESHIKFIKKYNLKIELISDPDIKLITELGSWVKKSMYGKSYMGIQRSTFIIDEKCKVLKIWHKVRVPNHASEVLKTLSELS